MLRGVYSTQHSNLTTHTHTHACLPEECSSTSYWLLLRTAIWHLRAAQTRLSVWNGEHITCYSVTSADISQTRTNRCQFPIWHTDGAIFSWVLCAFFFFVLPLFPIPRLFCKVYTLILVCKRVKASVEVCRRSNSWSLLLCATNANVVCIEPATNNTFFDLNLEPHWVLEALIRKLQQGEIQTQL